MMKLYMGLGMVVLIGLIITAGTIYFKTTQAKIENLTASNAKLEGVVETQEATLAKMMADAEAQKIRNAALAANLRQSEEGIVTLRQKLSRHNLTGLALAKPGLIERRINDGTKAAFDQFRIDTRPE